MGKIIVVIYGEFFNTSFFSVWSALWGYEMRWDGMNTYLVVACESLDGRTLTVVLLLQINEWKLVLLGHGL
jgi:hypothetical protein